MSLNSPSPQPSSLPNHKSVSSSLLTDLYQLTMVQAYLEEGMSDSATFSLFVRRLPKQRNYLLACGLDDALSFLEALQFDNEAIEYLDSMNRFSDSFLRQLKDFRFTGDVYAVAEGTPVFANEPILEVVAPIPQAQLVESALMNLVHLQTVLASKASRVVIAAQGRQVIDFGLRRIHGRETALTAARAFRIAGVDATSNVAAGQTYGMTVAGTMAHSYIQAHDDEYEAYRSFARIYPETVLLVDTYDTEVGIEKVIRLAHELGNDFKVSAIRLDSGDLLSQSIAARQRLDEASLSRVSIFASGNLNENNIQQLINAKAPIDGFGIGTDMGVSTDAPSLDIVYKLVEYSGRGRVKLSPGKAVLPGRKQTFRAEKFGLATYDVIAKHDESPEEKGLLLPVMKGGKRLGYGYTDLERARNYSKVELAKLPDRIQAVDPATPPYEVRISESLQNEQVNRTKNHEDTPR